MNNDNYKIVDNNKDDDWEDVFWNWVDKIKNNEPRRRVMRINSRIEKNNLYHLKLLFHTGARVNFEYNPTIHELSVYINISSQKNNINKKLRDTKNEIHSEISGQWYWEECYLDTGLDINLNIPDTIYELARSKHKKINGFVIKTEW